MFDEKKYMKEYHINHREKRLERCKQWRIDNQEYAREYRREWLRNNLENWEEYTKKWREKNSEYNKNYRENNHEKIREQRKRYREMNQIIIKAQRIANKAFPIRQKCSVFGCNELGEKHHPNYKKPLEIIWLCRNHHREYHKNIQFQPALQI